MNVTLCSAFRNSISYIERYFCQLEQLQLALKRRGDALYLVLGEGDSTDGTCGELLMTFACRDIDGAVYDVSHGGEAFGSVVDPQRFKQLSGVCNKIWAQIPDSADVVIWAESDLIWTADVMIALIDRLKEYPAVAPMIMERSTSGWYDCWAFRKDGKHFTKQAPYFDGWPATEDGQSMIQIDSAGSVLAMNAELARHLVWPEHDVVVGICSQVYALGASVWLDCSLSVAHA